jgi:hypothetical protein
VFLRLVASATLACAVLGFVCGTPVEASGVSGDSELAAGASPQLEAIKRKIVARFNEINARQGTKPAMRFVRAETVRRLPELSRPGEQRLLARGVLVWANEMRLATDGLQSIYKEFTGALGATAGFRGAVPWRRSDAEAQIGTYLWDGELARQIRCTGRYNERAWFDQDSDTYFFTEFRCGFSQNDGRSSFTLTVADGASRFRTSEWSIPSDDPGPRQSGSVAQPCHLAALTIYDRWGIDCSGARAILSAYLQSGSARWDCSGGPYSEGECTSPGFDGYFHWRP